MSHQKSAFEAVDASVAQALAFRPPEREAMHQQKYDLPDAPTFPPLEDDDYGKSGHPPAHKLANRVILQRGTDLHPEPIRWLWRHWLALGKLHILAGAPGQGKTTLALAMAATVTVGGRWPDGTRVETGNILIWSGEDDPADTLLPRLLAAGADRDRCYFIQGAQSADGKMQPFDPARDLDALRQAIADIGGMRLLIVDPVVSAVTGDSHKNTEVRRALQPLVDLASECGCAVLGDCWTPADEAQRSVLKAGFSKKQVWTASKKLGVIRKKGENGARDGWYWRLPQDSGSTQDSVQDSKIPDFQNVESWNLGKESSANNPGVKAEKEVF